jgi:hypothetical protein
MQTDLTDHGAIWIGGFLAILGTSIALAGPILNDLVGKRFRRQKLLRNRYEELTECVAVTLAWFPKLAECRSLDEVNKSYPPPESRRLCVLSMIYFPELKKSATDYHNALIAYYHAAVDCCDQPLIGVASVGALMAKRREERGETQDQIVVLRQRLDDIIEKYAVKYTKA